MALPTPADRRPLPSSTRAAAAHPGTSTGRAHAGPPRERWRRPVRPPWPRWGLWPLALAIATALPPAVTYAFTQSGAGVSLGNGIPMGHEWLTRLAALEVTGGDPIMPADPQDPRRNWTQGRAKNLDLSGASTQAELARLRALPYPDQRYQSTYQFVFDAILGERWVDLGGTNVAKGHLDQFNCFDAVAQEPPDVQYDHFMRRYDDRNGDGGVNAAQQSRQRFVRYFVAAAMAPRAQMRTWDGGAYSTSYTVDRNYYLMGRAAHLLQDSFSTEHTVRDPGSNLERLLQVKSYLCAAGSEQHTHDNRQLLTYASGDVIWRPGTQLQGGWSGYKPSNMKVPALVALEASKDLWAAFIRTMGTPYGQREAKATEEAEAIARNWMSFDDQAMQAWYDEPAHRDATYVLAQNQRGPGRSVADCMRGLGEPSGDQMVRVRQLEEDRRQCLFNIEAQDGYGDLSDPQLRLPFYWRWKDQSWLPAPENWQPPIPAADSGNRVRLRSLANQQTMTAPDGLVDNAWLYNRAGTPVEFVQVSGAGGASWFRAADQSDLFLSYRAATGAVKLYASPAEASFSVAPARAGMGLRNLYWNQYLWLSGESPYLTRSGDPNQPSGQWSLDPSPPR